MDQASYELSQDAEQDWLSILQYTYDNFGSPQVKTYSNHLEACIQNMVTGKVPSKTLKIEGMNVISIRCRRHYIFGTFRPMQSFLILGIFHERMQLMQRLKNRL